MSALNPKELKTRCFIQQADPDYYSMRLHMAGGRLEADKLAALQKLATEYARGFIHLTSRQCIEIPFIHGNDIPAVQAALAESGLELGACGGGVRTVTACQGSSVCKSGLLDSQALAAEIDRRYYGRALPHKFKIGITGCRNNCLKAEENDLGIKGAALPSWKPDACTYCGLCEKVCPAGAIAVNREDQALTWSEKDCIACGRCIKRCPTNAWEGTEGVLIYFGGLFGNRIAIGKRILPVITDPKDLHAIIEAVLAFYQEHGREKERFRNTLDRVGWKALRKALKPWLKRPLKTGSDQT